MDAKNLTFPGGFILGAGLMYLLDPERNRIKNADIPMSARCLAGMLGVAAVAVGARLFARRVEANRSTATAFDLDVPNYAWLR
jgi:hypothetical protein